MPVEIIRETELTQTLRLQDGAEVIRQRTPGAWELRYSLGRDPATDKRRVATATIRGTRREAEKELRRLLRTLDLNENDCAGVANFMARSHSTGSQPQNA